MRIEFRSYERFATFCSLKLTIYDGSEARAECFALADWKFYRHRKHQS
jgi:hypothetical protein